MKLVVPYGVVIAVMKLVLGSYTNLLVMLIVSVIESRFVLVVSYVKLQLLPNGSVIEATL
jgi:hypothetical protein